MDMRHRSTPVQTCQRYAVREDRVNSAAKGDFDTPNSVFRCDTPQPWGQLVWPCGQLVDPQGREDYRPSSG
jgi:hypothetical protein